MAKSKAQEKLEQQLAELTIDLQRTRADFENYRKRMEAEKANAKELGKSTAILKLLPVIDTIERAITHTPDDIADHAWVKGIAGIEKNLMSSLESLSLKKIDASPGVVFDPALHDAIQMDEDAEGEQEVVAEQLQAGYMLAGVPIRHAMVKVTRK